MKHKVYVDQVITGYVVVEAESGEAAVDMVNEDVDSYDIETVYADTFATHAEEPEED